MATTTKSTGFKVPCPHCGAMGESGGLRIDIEDLTVTCSECDEAATREDLEFLAAEARRLVRWLDMADETV